MRGISKAALTLGLVAVFSVPAWAQGQGRGGPGGGMWGRGGVVGLIPNKSVQEELKLEPDQIEKAKGVAEELREKVRESMSGLGDLDMSERMKKIQEVNWTTNEEGFKALGTFMKPEQIKRFKEIVLQQQGANALSYPPLAKKLDVTNEQKGKIAAILAEEMTEIRNAMQDGDRGAITKIRKSTNDKALAVMTDVQQKQWKEMLGEPFEVKMEGGPGGDRPRRKNDN